MGGILEGGILEAYEGQTQDPELQELLQGLVQANVRQQEKLWARLGVRT